MGTWYNVVPEGHWNIFLRRERNEVEMKTQTELRTLLRSIDHKSYPAYKSLAGAWKFDRYTLVIDHVQGDPFAAPSSLHVEIPHTLAKFPPAYYQRDCSRIALQDYLTRQVAKQFEQYNFRAKGSGKSGLLSISRCGQAVLERSACSITGNDLIVRFHVGFPAFGRTINAGELDKILFEFLPRCVENSLFYARLDSRKVEAAVHLAEDQNEVRRILKEEKLVAFVANGSVLPRKSGVSDLPMADSVPFTSPASMERTFQLPHRGEISGMAVPEGITLIVGGLSRKIHPAGGHPDGGLRSYCRGWQGICHHRRHGPEASGGGRQIHTECGYLPVYQ